MLAILRNLYLRDLERSQYTSEDALRCTTDMGMSNEQVDLGMYLAQEYGVFESWSRTNDSQIISSFTIGEGILRLNSSTVWDERVAFYNASCEQAGSPSSLLPTATFAGVEAPASAPEWHPVIEQASRRLFEDSHFREAVLNAYISVIQAVKAKLGMYDKDGDKLMNDCFGCDGRVPIIRFNPCISPAEIDEQRGILYLFKGIVGIRNLHAHTIGPLDDKRRANEHLGLASLLMYLLDGATVASEPESQRES